MPFLPYGLGRNMEQSYRMELWCPWTTDLSPLSLKSDPPRVDVCVCVCWSVLGKGCLQLDAYWAPGCRRVTGGGVGWGGGDSGEVVCLFSLECQRFSMSRWCWSNLTEDLRLSRCFGVFLLCHSLCCCCCCWWWWWWCFLGKPLWQMIFNLASSSGGIGRSRNQLAPQTDKNN